MDNLNPEYLKRLAQTVNQSPYFLLLSMRILDLGPGFSHLELDLSNKHLQPFGIVHGGVIASIIDAATFYAVFVDLEDQSDGLTSVDLKLNYLAPSTSGKIISKGRKIKVGKTLGYAEAEVLDESGRILAHGTSTLMILPGKGMEVEPPFPPKFKS